MISVRAECLCARCMTMCPSFFAPSGACSFCRGVGGENRMCLLPTPVRVTTPSRMHTKATAAFHVIMKHVLSAHTKATAAFHLISRHVLTKHQTMHTLRRRRPTKASCGDGG